MTWDDFKRIKENDIKNIYKLKRQNENDLFLFLNKIDIKSSIPPASVNRFSLILKFILPHVESQTSKKQR